MAIFIQLSKTLIFSGLVVDHNTFAAWDKNDICLIKKAKQNKLTILLRCKLYTITFILLKCDSVFCYLFLVIE